MSARTADANIHIRVRPSDRDLVDRAAELTGANRSQFVMAAALKEAMNILFDNNRVVAGDSAFNAICDWLDNPKSAGERAGVDRLKSVRTPW